MEDTMKTTFRLLAFLLILSILAGCAPLAAASSPTATPTQPSAVTATSDDATLTITLADNGKTFELPTGKSFLLKLGEDYDWQVSFLPQDVFSRVMGVMVVRGAQGLYRTGKPGQADLKATGNPTCLTAKPACALPSIEFKVTIVVK